MSYQPKIYKDTSGDRQVVASGGEVQVESGGLLEMQSGSIATGVVLNSRNRFTIAQVNAGADILPALAGYKYRMIDCAIQIIGGAAAAVTTVDIIGTQTTAQKLVAFAQAQLTDDAYLKPGITGATVLADGASFVANDSGAAITIGKTGSAVTTATHFDVILTYAIEAA